MDEIKSAQDVNRAIEQSTEYSVQSAKTAEITGGIWVVNWMARAGEMIAPWWSTTRDVQLRSFWKKSDHLSGALYTMLSKMTAIPNKIVPDDISDRDSVNEAKRLSDVIWGSSQFGDGWETFYAQWVEDLLTQDNGAFAEVIGRGKKDGPIIGQPISIAHLDSSRCTRTGNSKYPVIYEDIDGNRYKLHYTRVMFASQMTSPIADMYGVGFCAVSRALNVAQTLVDILVYKQEKLGSRPHRQIIITKGGLDPEDLQSAFQLAESNMDQQGLSRYSKVVVGGSSSIPEAGLDVVELSSMPDGFDEQTSTILGMATIALAFGVDARELFPAMQTGATRADALVQHLKQRGKGPGQIIQITERLMNYKYVPEGMHFVFDFQDDAQDKQVAEIRKIRSDRRVQDSTTGALTERTLREQMVEDGEIKAHQFERIELQSGRTADGYPITSLFFSNNRELSQYLDLGVEDPMDVRNNNQEEILNTIGEKRRETLDVMANSSSDSERWYAEQAFYALANLELQYMGGGIGQEMEITNGGMYIDRRIRTQDEASPTDNDMDEGEQIERSDELYNDEE